MTITPEPQEMSPNAKAGLALVNDNPHLGRYLAEIREGAREVQPGSAKQIRSAISGQSAKVRRYGPAHCRQAANIWRGADMDNRLRAAQEIINAAIRAGQPAAVEA